MRGSLNCIIIFFFSQKHACKNEKKCFAYFILLWGLVGPRRIKNVPRGNSCVMKNTCIFSLSLSILFLSFSIQFWSFLSPFSSLLVIDPYWGRCPKVNSEFKGASSGLKGANLGIKEAEQGLVGPNYVNFGLKRAKLGFDCVISGLWMGTTWGSMDLS